MPLTDDEKAELVAYLDGELDEVSTQAVEARIASDPETRAELDALKQTWGLLDFLPQASPSPNFTNRTIERLTIETEAPPAAPPPADTAWITLVGWAAAILLAVGLGYGAMAYYWKGVGKDSGDPSKNGQPIHPEPIADADLPLVRHLRIAERWRAYENAGDIAFAKQLNHPDLFADEPQ